MMNRTITVNLVTSSRGRDESQQIEDLLHGHHRSHSLKIDARHRIGPENTRRGNPYFSVSQKHEQSCLHITYVELGSYDGLLQESTHEFSGGAKRF